MIQRHPAARITLGILSILTFGLGCAADDGRLAIRQVLDRQAEAWNRADIEGFMSGYWKSDAMTFSASGVTHRGWEAASARYRTRYPTPEAMGLLTFSDLEFTPLGSDAMLVLGHWHLARADGPLNGVFTLILRRIGGQWLIIHDHSS